MKLLALAVVFLTPLIGGAVEGRVTNSVTGEPVSGVSVRLLDRLDRHSYLYTASTDSSGSYRVTGLDDGEYSGEFTHDGFQDNSHGTPSVKVTGDVSAHIDARLNPWGSLSGRVVDEDGQSARKVAVEISPRGGSAVTDENGEFVFRSLWPGAYTVVAKPEATTRLRDGERVGAAPIYYPSATQADSAARIPVKWGEDAAGIVIRLKSVPVRRVTGVVLDESGKPMTHATVKLMGKTSQIIQLSVSIDLSAGRPNSYTMAPSPGLELARVETREDGAFEFPAVQQGDWRVDAEIGREDDMPLTAAASISVAEKDIDGLELRLGSPFAVEVTSSDNASPARLVMLSPADGQPHLNIDPETNINSVHGILPGRYRVTGSYGGKSYVSSVMLGGTDVLGRVIELSPEVGPLQVVTKRDASALRGTVENGEGATVFLVSKELRETIVYRMEVCGAGGAFEFSNVPPGDYFVVAFNAGNSTPLPGDFGNLIAPLATGVRVEASSAASVSLRANSWPW